MHADSHFQIRTLAGDPAEAVQQEGHPLRVPEELTVEGEALRVVPLGLISVGRHEIVEESPPLPVQPREAKG